MLFGKKTIENVTHSYCFVPSGKACHRMFTFHFVIALVEVILHVCNFPEAGDGLRQLRRASH